MCGLTRQGLKVIPLGGGGGGVGTSGSISGVPALSEFGLSGM